MVWGNCTPTPPPNTAAPLHSHSHCPSPGAWREHPLKQRGLDSRLARPCAMHPAGVEHAGVGASAKSRIASPLTHQPCAARLIANWLHAWKPVAQQQRGGPGRGCRPGETQGSSASPEFGQAGKQVRRQLGGGHYDAHSPRAGLEGVSKPACGTTVARRNESTSMARQWVLVSGRQLHAFKTQRVIRRPMPASPLIRVPPCSAPSWTNCPGATLHGRWAHVIQGLRFPAHACWVLRAAVERNVQ